MPSRSPVQDLQRPCPKTCDVRPVTHGRILGNAKSAVHSTCNHDQNVPSTMSFYDAHPIARIIEVVEHRAEVLRSFLSVLGAWSYRRPDRLLRPMAHLRSPVVNRSSQMSPEALRLWTIS